MAQRIHVLEGRPALPVAVDEIATQLSMTQEELLDMAAAMAEGISGGGITARLTWCGSTTVLSVRGTRFLVAVE